MAKVIEVRGAGSDNKIVLWERDRAHPRGEVVVANDGKVYRVGVTATVERLVGEGLLVNAQIAPATPQTPATKTAPWDGYEGLKAEEVIAQLGDLDDAGRAAVLAYEQARGDRGRKSIIEKLVNWNS